MLTSQCSNTRRPSILKALSLYVPMFGYLETQYPNNGRVIYRAPRILVVLANITSSQKNVDKLGETECVRSYTAYIRNAYLPVWVRVLCIIYFLFLLKTRLAVRTRKALPICRASRLEVCGHWADRNTNGCTSSRTLSEQRYNTWFVLEMWMCNNNI